MVAQNIEPSRYPFGRALGEVLRDRGFTTRSGNVNWHAFADEKLEGLHYESLRKAVAGERKPTPSLMEQVAAALEIDPSYFAEYRIHTAEKSFDVALVGFDQALANFDEWATARAAEGTRTRRRRA